MEGARQTAEVNAGKCREAEQREVTAREELQAANEKISKQEQRIKELLAAQAQEKAKSERPEQQLLERSKSGGGEGVVEAVGGAATSDAIAQVKFERLERRYEQTMANFQNTRDELRTTLLQVESLNALQAAMEEKLENVYAELDELRRVNGHVEEGV